MDRNRVHAQREELGNARCRPAPTASSSVKGAHGAVSAALFVPRASLRRGRIVSGATRRLANDFTELPRACLPRRRRPNWPMGGWRVKSEQRRDARSHKWATIARAETAGARRGDAA
ncbi:hypothetical protein PF003_g33827 [Phytophthora fragariae]|nr:hypothetical protein PF003_g33827 [Phytophthora fragariae]